MGFESFVANKVGASKEEFANKIIRISKIGVALSIAVMILTSSFIQGFQKEISAKIFSFWGHIHIIHFTNTQIFETEPISKNQDFYPHLDTLDRIVYQKQYYKDFQDNLELSHIKKMTSKGGISRIQPFAFLPGIISNKDGFEGIYLKGIDEDFDFETLEMYLEDGSIFNPLDSGDNRSIVISTFTAVRLNLKVGDPIIVSCKGRKNLQLSRGFNVKGIYNTGLGEYDKRFALVSLNTIREILGWEDDQVGGFEVFIDDLDDLNLITEYVHVEVLPGEISAESIRSKIPSIFDWLSLQTVNEYVILILMIIVAIINMTTGILIFIIEKSNMIGLFKALGSNNWPIRKIFLRYALKIILFGLFWGNVIGLSLAALQKYLKVISLNEADYYISNVPVHFNIWWILMINIGALLIVLTCMIVPTYYISTVKPTKILKFD